MSLPARIAFVDLETTGAHPLRDDITEIAIIRVEDGRVVQRWESLVNPGRPIPQLIQRVIGITDEMVASAPVFAELADTVAALLQDCVFVAHNARFDYGFLKNAFAGLGRNFEAPVLCTIKLSRALFPEHHRHGLDALIERHGLVCEARHRAMGDSDALHQFVRLAERSFSAETLAPAVARAMKAPPRPPGLPEGAVEGLPDAPGAYLFFASEVPPASAPDLPLFVGRSPSLRARVLEHFASANNKGKDADLLRQVRRVDWIETAGELGAILLEASLLKTRQPLHNRVRQAGESCFALRLAPGRRRPPVLERVRIEGSNPREWEGLYGAWRERKEVDSLLRELAALYQLCPQRLGIEPAGKGACAAHRDGRRCAGVCAGKESADAHDVRLRGALGSAALEPWPWAGAVIVAEQHPPSGLEAFHVLDRWCHLGTATTRGEVAGLLGTEPRFELDTYRILSRWFAIPNRRGEVEVL